MTEPATIARLRPGLVLAGRQVHSGMVAAPLKPLLMTLIDLLSRGEAELNEKVHSTA